MREMHNAYGTSAVAEMTNGIILAKFEKSCALNEGTYQSEAQLEKKLIESLISQGYERLFANNSEELYENLRKQIERLNSVSFTDGEWKRFLSEYLDCPNDGIIEKTRKVQENHIYDFIFDDGRVQNIKIIDKKNIYNNILQVANQVKQSGTHANRYDVTIFVNGLPLVHIELKKRGVNLHEAFNQIHRYSKESFNTENSLYKYVQIFVISNGTYTRYFANTTLRSKNNYCFTCEWADAKNTVIHDLEDFTRTFFEKRVILEVLTKYCVFDVENTLLIMRPYQIAAVERILWKIRSSYESKKYGNINAGGFVWHTTGSGKTLTSFKAARLATKLPFIDKVLFVVDRKDLDSQTIREYERYQPNSVSGSKDTKALKEVIEKYDNRIVVTTIQKLNEFVKRNPHHPIYEKQCVLIYDECHRSQFGESQKNIRKAFKKYYQFGFTGTPIFTENSLDGSTTSEIFGAMLHSYVITDAIRDGKVLKFKVDYNNISAKFKSAECEYDDMKLNSLESKMLLHPERIAEITRHILSVFNVKTHRNEFYSLKEKRVNGFNAIFAVQSIDAAKLYYEEFQKQQKDLPEEKRLKVATIYSFAANEEQSSIGDIVDESFDVSAMNSSAKEFLDKVISDYNEYFKTNYSTESKGFHNYYIDLSNRVKGREIDLLIVVGMFLTGFNAECVNTLFVDKNLRYHGLIQAFSRTNRILDNVKTFGNIVCFRDLENATKDAIKIFGDENSLNVILERSYDDYMHGFVDDETGRVVKGYKEICNELLEKFSDPTCVILDFQKKEFVELFGEYLTSENILRNFDEFQNFKSPLSQRLIQDMRSVYVDIREEFLHNKKSNRKGSDVDFSDLEFKIDLLKTDEINLEYILSIILEKSIQNEDIESMKAEVRRIIRSSLGTRAKEKLIIDFINKTDLKQLKNVDDILEAFYTFAKGVKENVVKELIIEEDLKENSKDFIEKSIKKGYVEYAGTEVDSMVKSVSRRHGARQKKKENVLDKIRKIVEVFVGI